MRLSWGWIRVQGRAGQGWREEWHCRQKEPGHCLGGCRWIGAVGGGVQGRGDEAGGEGHLNQGIKPESCPEGDGSHRMAEGMKIPARQLGGGASLS